MKKKIKINGMSCEHCVKRVKNAMEGIEGVNNVQIDLSAGEALFDATDDVKDGDIKYAVEDAGYDVVNIEIVV